MHGLRRLLLAVVWGVVLISLACHEKHQLVLVALSSLTVAIAFWSSHVRVGSITSLKSFALALAGGVWETMVQALFLLPVLFVIAQYSCYTDRAKATEVLMSLIEAKIIITERVRESGTVLNSGEGVIVKASGRLSIGVVLPDGTIVGAADDPPVVFILGVNVTGREVTWTCRGFPAKIVPIQCREQKSN